MKKLLFPILLCALLAAACVPFLNSGTWRYRMTVEVETPEGLKTGSAVREVHKRLQPAPLPEMNPVKTTVKGEAVVVDLGERGQLYALLRSERDVDYAGHLVERAFPAPDGVRGIDYYDDLEASRELPLRLYPMLVTFADASDPTSVQLALKTRSERPDHLFAKVHVVEDNFEKLFGKGVRLKRITIEMTDDAVTESLFHYLPWFKEKDAVNKLGLKVWNLKKPSIENYLTYMDFRRGN